MESAPNTPEQIDRKQPHRIGHLDIHEAKESLDDLKKAVRDTEGKPADWQKLHENIDGFNHVVADLLQDAITQAANDEERQRIAEIVWTLYWAANYAHYPKHRLEHDPNDDAQRRVNAKIVNVEQTKV